MKLHLPVLLRKSVLSCLAAVALCTLGSGVAWAENLSFEGATLTWDTQAESFTNEDKVAAAFAPGDDVSFTRKSNVTLGEDISAGTVAIEKGADVTIDLDVFELKVDRIELSGLLDMGCSLNIGAGTTLAMNGAGAVLDSNLILGEEGVLSVTGAGGSLNGHSLTLQEGASLILTGAVLSRETTDVDQDGELSLIVTPTGDGKTYTLLTGVSALVDKEGNALTAGSYSTDDLFDSSQPGAGFWAGGTLVYAADGTLTLIRHNEIVKDALDVTSRQTRSVDYSYYKGISFKELFSSSYGGAIYGGYDSTIMLSNNGSVSFSGNTASSSSSASGGAIYGKRTITLSGNGSVSFSENTANSSYDDAHGGAIYGSSYSTITLSGNGSVSFSGNTASTTGSSSDAYGGAIYGSSSSTITLSDNESVSFSENTASTTSSSFSYASGGAIYGSSTINLSGNGSVTFSGNTVSGKYAYGGAIYGDYDSTITLSDNESVSLSGNTASTTGSSSDASGGAIYGGTITLSDTESVSFSGNTASGSSSSSAYGGAIFGSSYSTITLSGNESVSFSENTASSSDYDAFGGAIFGDSSSTITLSGNGSVSFSGNTASSRYSDAFGGAIDGYSSSTITLSGNESVSFSENTVSTTDSSSDAFGGAIYGDSGSTITLSGNESVSFSGNTASSSSYFAYGGAVYGYSSITLSGNGSVSFSGNTASGKFAYGGAIYGDDSSSITLSDNGSVSFSGNTASGSSDAYGGAIRVYGHLFIQNNDSVLFEKNVEKSGSSYRLRSIDAGGSGNVISLSAAEGKSIEFRDSVYIASGSTFNLNADYTDDEGVVHKQTGDIIFTGAYTEADLLAVKGSKGTAAEILNSRTSEVYTQTKLYGGRLRVEDGAIYQGQGIIAHAGSEATVLVKDATLSHSGYDLTFNAGTTLELVGDSKLAGNLMMLSGSILSLDSTMNLNGSLTLGNEVVLGGGLLDDILSMKAGDTLTLVSGLESLHLQTQSLIRSLEYITLLSGELVNASDYFVNLKGYSGLVFSYDSNTQTLNVIYAIPEPTTTTLSLLALAALAARRRRK